MRARSAAGERTRGDPVAGVGGGAAGAGGARASAAGWRLRVQSRDVFCLLCFTFIFRTKCVGIRVNDRIILPPASGPAARGPVFRDILRIPYRIPKCAPWCARVAGSGARAGAPRDETSKPPRPRLDLVDLYFARSRGNLAETCTCSASMLYPLVVRWCHARPRRSTGERSQICATDHTY
jgi:hypothetical protein